MNVGNWFGFSKSTKTVENSGRNSDRIMRRKSAQIISTRFYTHIFSWADCGMLFADPKGYDVYSDPALSRAELVRYTLNALRASRYIPIDHPDWKEFEAMDLVAANQVGLKSDLARAGVRTSTQLYNGAGEVLIDMTGGQLTIRPLRHEGRGYWGPVPTCGPIDLPEDISEGEFGAAILEKLEISRTAARR